MFRSALMIEASLNRIERPAESTQGRAIQPSAKLTLTQQLDPPEAKRALSGALVNPLQATA